MNAKHAVFIHLIIAIKLLFSSCTNPKKPSDKIVIVATTSIIADVVLSIVGDGAEVISLMGPGVDPHLYKASQGDVKLLQNADLVVYNGLHLEGKMSEILEKMSRNKRVIAVSDGIDPSDVRTINADANVHDPHIWFDMNIWAKGVDYVAKEIATTFPSLKPAVEMNTNSYLSQIDSIKTLCDTLISRLPKEKRVLITSHDAFEYFGRSHGFTVKGLQGISTLSESGLKDVTNMVNFIIDNQVKAVFVENSVPQKALRSVIDGCRSKGHEVVVGGELFSDALGAARTPEGTYLGMVEFNVTTIVNALK